MDYAQVALIFCDHQLSNMDQKYKLASIPMRFKSSPDEEKTQDIRNVVLQNEAKNTMDIQ